MAAVSSGAGSAQRDIILDIAADTFADRGYPAASMSELARRCGVSKALLYHYYASKDAILFDLLDRYTQGLLGICDRVEGRVPAPRERLAALVRAFLDEYRMSQTRHVVLVHDVKFLPPVDRERIVDQMREVVARYRTVVSEAFPSAIPETHLTAVTMMLFGMMNWTFTWLKPDGPLSYSDFADAVIHVFGEGVPRLASAGARSGTSPSRRSNGRDK